MEEAARKKKSIGLVLSGGGVRGMAHIGLIRAMEEAGISASHISGSSVGAIVGALYANSVPVEDMLNFFRETPLFRYNFFTINKPGLLDTDRYFEIFKSYLPHDSFEALHKQLFVMVTNLQKGRQQLFSEGELIRPLLASAALPPVFSPVEIENCLYADGGIMNNFPSEPLANKVDYLIGSNVSVVKELDKRDIRTSMQLTNRTTALMIYAINENKTKCCNLLLQPQKLERIGVLDKKSMESAYSIGYEYAIRQLELSNQPWLAD